MSAYPPSPHTAAAVPAQIATSDLFASRWRRFFALTIDWLIFSVPLIVFTFLFAVLAAADTTTTQEEDEAIAGAVIIVMIIGTATFLFAYLPLLLARNGARNGQTLGKQLLGVRVVTIEGVPVTYGRALRRELLGNWLINFFTFSLYALIDYAFGLFDDRRQCLHDKIASTYVIKEQVPFGDGRQLLPPRSAIPAGAYVPAQPAQAPPPYGQPSAPPYGQPSAPPYGQTPPYVQPTAPPYGPPIGQQPTQPIGEPTYPRAPEPAAPAPPAPAPPASGPEVPQQRWEPPADRDGQSGNDEARRAFGDS